MKFTLEITLGNDAMQTGEDIAHSLREVASKVQAKYGGAVLQSQLYIRIRDVNGNKVGSWSIVEDSE